MLKVGSKIIVTFLKEIKKGANGREFRNCSLGEPSKTEHGTEYKNYNAILYGDNINILQDRTRIQLEDFGVDKNTYTDKSGNKQTGVTIFIFKFSIVDDVKPKQKQETKLEPITDDALPF